MSTRGRDGWRLAIVNFDRVLAPSMLDDLLPACEEWRPDLVIYDQSSHAAPVLAAILDVPSVCVAVGVLYPEEVLAFEDEILEPFWRANGLEPRPWGGEFERLRLDQCPPSMRPVHASRFSTSMPLRPVPASSGPGEWSRHAIRPNRPLVYMTLGTLYGRVDLFRSLLAGLAEVECDVLVTTGAVDPSELGPTRPGVTIERFVDQERVLPHASAVICHGGAGSLFGALRHGRPTGCVPLAADQYWNAEAAETTGSCVVLDAARLSQGLVAEATKMLLHHQQTSAAAARVAAEIRSMPAAEDYIDTFERLVSA